MNTKHLSTIVAAAAFTLLAQTSFAQMSPPASRADVNAQTKSAVQTGTQTPAGEGDVAASGPKTSMSGKSHKQTKAQNRADRANGKMAPAGQHVDPKAEKNMKPSQTQSSDTSGSGSMTKDNVKGGMGVPAGEGVGPKK